MSRVRFVAATIQLQLVNDDGEQLHPLNVQPLVVPASEWPPDLDAVIAQIQQQVNPVAEVVESNQPESTGGQNG